MDEREKNLPKWAQEIITYLRKQVAESCEPLVRELKSMRPRMEELKARNEAMTELLECAARGGHMTSQQIVNVIGQYSLRLVKEDL